MQQKEPRPSRKVQPGLGREEVITRLKTRFLADGTYMFEDQVDVKETVTTKVITCRAWLLEIYDVEGGELFFINGETKFVQPQSVAEFFIRRSRSRSLVLSE
jgi:hypothetical protein